MHKHDWMMPIHYKSADGTLRIEKRQDSFFRINFSGILSTPAVAIPGMIIAKKARANTLYIVIVSLVMLGFVAFVGSGLRPYWL